MSSPTPSDFDARMGRNMEVVTVLSHPRDHDLSPEACDVLVALAYEWSGTIDELVETARRIAATPA